MYSVFSLLLGKSASPQELRVIWNIGQKRILNGYISSSARIIAYPRQDGYCLLLVSRLGTIAHDPFLTELLDIYIVRKEKYKNSIISRI